jgi:xylulokinase
LTAGGNLDRALAMFNMPDYEALIDGIAPDPVHVIYLPYLNGERSPFVDPLARAAFIGIGAEADSGTLARAVLTGVAYGYRHALDELMDRPVDRLTITGGGTRSTAWMQIFADVLAVPVQVAADAENVGVRGAVIAATGTAEMVPIAQTIQPDTAHRAFYDRQYEVFRQAYPALKPVFAGLAGAQQRQ